MALTLAIIGIWYLEETSDTYPEALVGIFHRQFGFRVTVDERKRFVGGTVRKLGQTEYRRRFDNHNNFHSGNRIGSFPCITKS